MSGYAAGEMFARSERAFARAKGWLAGPEAAGLGLAGLEGRLAVLGREIQQRLLQDHLFAVAAAEPRRARVAGPDGVCRTRAERGHGRTLSSIFGPVTVPRIAYRAPGVPNVHLADERLGLPAGRHSPGLAKMAAYGPAAGSLAGACKLVTERTGCKLGTRQCQQLARAAACDFGAFYAAWPRPAPGPGQVLVLSCDAKGDPDAARAAAPPGGAGRPQGGPEAGRAAVPGRGPHPQADGRGRRRLRYRPGPAHPR